MVQVASFDLFNSLYTTDCISGLTAHVASAPRPHISLHFKKKMHMACTKPVVVFTDEPLCGLHKTVCLDHNLRKERRVEAESNRGLSACLLSTLPLGKTHVVWVTYFLRLSALKNNKFKHETGPFHSNWTKSMCILSKQLPLTSDQQNVLLVEFMFLVFTRMPGELP